MLKHTSNPKTAAAASPINLKHAPSLTPQLELAIKADLLMGRQNNDQTMIHSSIALLQERFRKLERLKEMREEKEQRVFVEGERGSPSTTHFQQPKWFFHSDLLRPSRPISSPPSQWIAHGDRAAAEYQDLVTTFSMSSNSTNAHYSITSNETDVDTSLHL